MDRHHEVAFDQALDQLYLEGATCIRWDHLYLWFSAERLNKGAYREIAKRWEELCVITRGHVDAPDLSILSKKYTLTLFRDAFEGEDSIPLSDWT